MVEQVRSQVCFYVVLSSNPTSDQVTPVEFSSVATNPAQKLRFMAGDRAP
jgi:hypothetical protein